MKAKKQKLAWQERWFLENTYALLQHRDHGMLLVVHPKHSILTIAFNNADIERSLSHMKRRAREKCVVIDLDRCFDHVFPARVDPFDAPLSPESQASLDRGIADAKAGRTSPMGESFEKYADDPQLDEAVRLGEGRDSSAYDDPPFRLSPEAYAEYMKRLTSGKSDD